MCELQQKKTNTLETNSPLRLIKALSILGIFLAERRRKILLILQENFRGHIRRLLQGSLVEDPAFYTSLQHMLDNSN